MSQAEPRPLCIVPLYLAQPQDLEIVNTCLQSLFKTEPEADVLVVDDHSPRRDLVDAVENLGLPLGLHRKDENTGFARTVNIGLRLAKEGRRDAILVNADLEFLDPGWIRAFQETRWEGKLASVVGARLLFPSGLIQHGGVYFSLLHRCFEHLYKFAPHDLPEAGEARVVPVTGALQFIRCECLEEVGTYDELFRMGWEDVDYCIRAWQSSRAVVYNPHVRAFHHESAFRGRKSDKLEQWQALSWAYFCKKWATTNFSEFIPSVV